MTPIHVFFFRGLSTYGKDDAKWTFFNFGPMYSGFSKAFKERGLVLHPVLGMGAGSLHEVTERARAYLQQHPVWRDPDAKVHFFGHSAGGLVARLLLQQDGWRDDKVLSLMTVATPNRGSELAQICVDMPERYRGSARILKTFGYNISRNRSFFEQLTPATINSMFEAYPKKNTRLRIGSVVCASPRAEWCVPLRLFYKLRAFNDFSRLSDGVVERDTQPFGEIVAELNIDHFRQIGLFGQSHRFQQLCDVLSDFFLRAQSGDNSARRQS
jgi:pimeloyl-ACP methyl ester carboxylesterase